MRFSRQKRWNLGLLALLAPFPLPFNEVLEWPVLAAYSVAVLFFLRRVRAEDEGSLPVWALNLLGLLYLPFLVFDLLVLGGGRLVGPLIHLLLFVVLAKLYSLRRERDKWHVVFAVFFLFLAAMGTSVHPSIIVYLLAFVGLVLSTLIRFARLHVLAGFSTDDEDTVAMPVRSFLTVVMVTIIVLAIPLFALLPRVRSPYIIGGGTTGTGTPVEAVGFSDEVTLDSIGRTRMNRDVVMRLLYEGAPPLESEMRFKAGAHYRYENGVWQRTGDKGREISRGKGGGFQLVDVPSRGSVGIWLQPVLGSRLALPVQTVRVETNAIRLQENPWGAVSLPQRPIGGHFYRALTADRPVLRGRFPNADDPDEPTLSRAGVTPRMAKLAREVAGAGTPRQKAEALETHFIREYDYTLDFVGRQTQAPLEDFLFRYRSGHCEYFASAMVLLLRSEGIPARLATGFLGAEHNPLEGYYIVRQLNAHAWVEAFLPNEGWQVFDPTPPGGRPGGGRRGWPGLLSQAYDYMMFRWDRYVMTYGFVDQVRMFFGLREIWQRLWSPFRGEDEPQAEEAAPQAAAAEATEDTPIREGVGGTAGRWLVAALFALVAVISALLLRHHGAQPAGALGYRRLRRKLARKGVESGEATGPLALVEAAAERYPAAAAPAAQVVDLYLRESFGEQPLDDEARQQLKESLSEADEALRRTAS